MTRLKFIRTSGKLIHESYVYFPVRIFPAQALSFQYNVSNTWEVYEEWRSRTGYMRQFLEYNKPFVFFRNPMHLYMCDNFKPAPCSRISFILRTLTWPKSHVKQHSSYNFPLQQHKVFQNLS